MITALSLNPAIDRTVLVPGFAAGATNRVVQSRVDPGGKGINAARVLKVLGADVRVLGFLGENNGLLITRHLQRQEIPADFIPVAGDNRVNLKVIDPNTGALTEVNDQGFEVDLEQVDRLVAMVRAALPQTSALVLAGSLPAGVRTTIYRDLIRLATEFGVPTVLDCDGEAMLPALTAGPGAIKPNLAETERLVGRALKTRAELVQAARELAARGPGVVVVSNGEQGAALVTADEGWWATPPTIHTGSSVGAGDSMVAGLTLAMVRRLPHPDALRLATAAGAATASLEGTQVCSSKDAARMLPRVTVTPILLSNEGVKA